MSVAFGVLRVLWCSMCWLLYGPFCHGALKLDVPTYFTTFFLWKSLQFIFSYNFHGQKVLLANNNEINRNVQYISIMIWTFYLYTFIIKPHLQFPYARPALNVLDFLLRLKLRNGLQRVHICIFYQNINENFLIIMLYVLWLYFLTIEKHFYKGSNLYLL